MRLSPLLSFSAVALLLSGAACSIDPESTTDEAEVALDEEGKADAATETRVRTGETSVWVRNEIRRETRADGRQVFVVRGRTSRDVTDGTAFVFDDVVGDWAKLSARTYEVTYATDDGGLLDGQDHFVRLHFKPSAGRPDVLTTRVVARPRLGSFSGTGLSLAADVKPIVVAGRGVFRITGTASTKIYGLRVRAGDVSLSDIKVIGDKKFQVDLLRDHVTAIAGTTAELTFEVDLSSGTKTKKAKLSLRLAELGITSDDPYEVWPPMTCTETVSACLQSLPDGALDLSSCGETVEVRACEGQVGVMFDDVAFGAAMSLARSKVSQSPAFVADAGALIGSDRLDPFTEGVEQTINDRLEQMVGRRYANAGARDAAVTAEIDAVIDLAYARPLDIYGEPHPAAPGNLVGTRHAVADALLLYLDSIDLEHTEFGRPLEVLARQYRSQHVAAIRAFRTTVEPDAQGDSDIFISNWLNPYVEISVVRATGVVSGVFFEID